MANNGQLFLGGGGEGGGGVPLNKKETYHPVPRKRHNRWIDRQTLFQRVSLASAGSQKKKQNVYPEKKVEKKVKQRDYNMIDHQIEALHIIFLSNRGCSSVSCKEY